MAQSEQTGASPEITTESGLKYVDLVVGTGREAAAGTGFGCRDQGWLLTVPLPAEAQPPKPAPMLDRPDRARLYPPGLGHPAFAGAQPVFQKWQGGVAQSVRAEES